MSEQAVPAAAKSESAQGESEGDKRQREQVERLLARSPVVKPDHVLLANGQRLDYQVRAAFVPVLAGGVDAERGRPQAAVFTIAYQVAPPVGAPARPVCFAFNGGPGSSSIWLHLGALGPKRVPVRDA